MANLKLDQELLLHQIGRRETPRSRRSAARRAAREEVAAVATIIPSLRAGPHGSGWSGRWAPRRTGRSGRRVSHSSG
jgi:hypothetical protein